MAAPRTGPMIGQPITPGTMTRGETTGSSWGWNMQGLNPLINALAGRWNEAMGYQLQDLSRMPGRNEIAFNEWLKKREFEREAQEYQMGLQGESLAMTRQEQARRAKMEEDALEKAEIQRRVALQSGVDRSRALQSQYGGPTPFNPAGSVADYYEYGQGAAGAGQSRGGGSTERVSDTQFQGSGPSGWAIQGCLGNPDGPGCQGTLAAAGYVRNPTSGVWELPPKKG